MLENLEKSTLLFLYDADFESECTGSFLFPHRALVYSALSEAVEGAEGIYLYRGRAAKRQKGRE